MVQAGGVVVRVRLNKSYEMLICSGGEDFSRCGSRGDKAERAVRFGRIVMCGDLRQWTGRCRRLRCG